MMNTHLCRKILSTGALLALMPGGYAQAEKPNIVLIMCDDMGWRDLSCFGNDRVATPNIDRLAKEGKDREYVRICYGKDLFVMDRRFRLHEDEGSMTFPSRPTKSDTATRRVAIPNMKRPANAFRSSWISSRRSSGNTSLPLPGCPRRRTG